MRVFWVIFFINARDWSVGVEEIHEALIDARLRPQVSDDHLVERIEPELDGLGDIVRIRALGFSVPARLYRGERAVYPDQAIVSAGVGDAGAAAESNQIEAAHGIDDGTGLDQKQVIVLGAGHMLHILEFQPALLLTFLRPVPVLFAGQFPCCQSAACVLL